MFVDERRRAIVKRLRRDGRVEVSALALELEVSEDTVRRDLAALEGEGLLQKTHGGAVRVETGQLAYAQRVQLRRGAKDAVGRLAATLVEPRQTLFIDAGSTALALAEALVAEDLTVVTTSLDVAQVLAGRPGLRLVVAGGEWNPVDRYFSGPSTVATLERYRADVAFLGACAVHESLGVTANGDANAQAKLAMLRGCARAVLLADGSKFGQLAPHAVAPVDAFALVVTDAAPAWLDPARVLATSGT